MLKITLLSSSSLSPIFNVDTKVWTYFFIASVISVFVFTFYFCLLSYMVTIIFDAIGWNTSLSDIIKDSKLEDFGFSYVNYLLLLGYFNKRFKFVYINLSRTEFF